MSVEFKSKRLPCFDGLLRIRISPEELICSTPEEFKLVGVDVRYFCEYADKGFCYEQMEVGLCARFNRYLKGVGIGKEGRESSNPSVRSNKNGQRELDDKVEELFNSGVDRRSIEKVLAQTPAVIDRSLRRLRREKRIEPLIGNGKKLEEVRRIIQELPEADVDSNALAQRIGVSRGYARKLWKMC